MSKQQEFDKLGVLGVDVDAVDRDTAADYICRRAAPGQPSGYVVKPYVEFIDRSYRNAELTDLLNAADLAVPDGIALIWAASYLYAGKRTGWRFWQTLFQIMLDPEALRWPLTDRAAGISFTWPLLEAAAERQLRIFLIGDPKHGSIDHTASTLRNGIPGLIITGTHTGRDPSEKPGRVSPGWLQSLANTITSAKPDLILVGMGFPLQERVCSYLTNHVGHGVFIGEGGTFDYERFGGQRPKAPSWVGRIGLEWLWRLGLEPHRVYRQLAIPRFIVRIWRER